jgi:hypothetical protein
MKGTLHKTGSGWQVWYHAKGELYHSSIRVKILPILDHGYVNGPGLSDSDDGQEVEFEIVANEGEPLGRGEQPYKQYAKLVDKATRPVTEDDAWLTMKEGDITVNFKPMPEFDDPKYPDYPTRLDQLREQAWDTIWKDFRANKNASYSWALFQYLEDNYNPPTKKQD